MAGTAVLRRLTWQVATVASVTRETATVVTIKLDVPDWPAAALATSTACLPARAAAG
jgi:hypothetical protein